MTANMRSKRVSSTTASLMVAFCRRAQSISKFEGKLTDADILEKMYAATVATRDPRLRNLFEKIKAQLSLRESEIEELRIGSELLSSDTNQEKVNKHNKISH